MRIFVSVLLSLVVFNVQARTDCELEHRSCELCDRDNNIERAALVVPGVVGFVPCMEFCETGSAIKCQKISSSAILKSIEEKIVISEDKGIALEIAKINPEAAIAFYGLYTLSQRVDVPSDSFVTLKSHHSYDEAVAVINGGEGGQSGVNNYHAKIYYKIIKDAGLSWLELRHRVLDENGQMIGKPYQDIKVGMDWIDLGKDGYWKPNWQITVNP